MPGAGNLVVLVLAGGQSQRFLAAGGGVHKLDADLDGESVLAQTLRVVERAGMRCQLVRPAGGSAGMGASIAMGVAASADAAGWLVLPGDLPCVAPATLHAVADGLRIASVVVPHHGGHHGHPVGFRREAAAALAALDGDSGARRVVAAYRAMHAVHDLALDDAGILLDIDTPADLERARRYHARLK